MNLVLHKPTLAELVMESEQEERALMEEQEQKAHEAFLLKLERERIQAYREMQETLEYLRSARN